MTGETIHVIVLIIQVHCQGQKVNLKVKVKKIHFSKKYNLVYFKNRSKLQKYLHLTLEISNGCCIKNVASKLCYLNENIDI